MNLALREFLDKRERELLEEIASIRQRLAPIEAELAEVQHAKDALGIPVTASIAETTAYSLPEGISIPLPGG